MLGYATESWSMFTPSGTLYNCLLPLCLIAGSDLCISWGWNVSCPTPWGEDDMVLLWCTLGGLSVELLETIYFVSPGSRRRVWGRLLLCLPLYFIAILLSLQCFSWTFVLASVSPIMLHWVWKGGSKVYVGDGLQLEDDGLIPGTIHQGGELKVTRDNEEILQGWLMQLLFSCFHHPHNVLSGTSLFRFYMGIHPHNVQLGII